MRRYLRLLLPIFNAGRTRQILSINPTVAPTREEAGDVVITVFDYDADSVHEETCRSIEEIEKFRGNGRVTWINIDGIRKKDVETVSEKYNIHPLLTEDILSVGQRPKTDEIDGVLFCLLNMLYQKTDGYTVEQEQISIILGSDFVISFQDDPQRDVFNLIRDRLRLQNSKLRQSKADYLCYSMIDLIVDHYYLVLEKLGDQIEHIEDEIIRFSNTRSLAKVNALRKELIVLKRNILPVRDLVSSIMRSDAEVLDERVMKYFKDVYDHIVQASDLVENYRDMMLNLQDLYMSRVNLRLNEVMKVMAIVTCLLAPATVIGGIFGMNFDIIPIAHQRWGFYVAVGAMVVIPAIMLVAFRKRGWF
jgi:magnesium transporter